MNTPIADFVRQYAASDTARLHMPGHKGRAFLGCEALDITEIAGADALYEAVEARDLPGMADVDFSLLVFCRRIRESAAVRRYCSVD